MTRLAPLLLLLVAATGCTGGSGTEARPSPAPAESSRLPDTVAGSGIDCVDPVSPPLESGGAAPVTVEVDSLGAARPLDVHGGIYRIPPGPPLVPGSYPTTVGRDRDRLAVNLPPESGGPSVPVTLVGPIVCQ